MKKSLVLVALLLPVVGTAQPVIVEPVHPAVPILPNWNIGAGIGLTFGVGGLAGLVGGGYPGGSAGPLSGISVQPRATVLIERRLSERVFLTFQVGASYRTSQDDVDPIVKGHFLSLDGTLGIRRIFNPGGIVEVSWFGNAGVSYTNYETRFIGYGPDPTGALVQVLNISRGHNFGVGALTGLTLERELMSGLALRLSTGIIGFGYGKSANTLTTPQTKTDLSGHGFDIGLRFNPAIELRYAF